MTIITIITLYLLYFNAKLIEIVIFLLLMSQLCKAFVILVLVQINASVIVELNK